MSDLPRRPVWLFSMDSDNFWAAPSTTGGLKAYYQHYGKRCDQTDIELVHFKNDQAIEQWLNETLNDVLASARSCKIAPVIGFSVYTWNAAQFLALIQILKTQHPEFIVIAGGPHVQQAEDYLHEDPIDVICLGEGEETFSQLLDCVSRDEWHGIDGVAFLDDNQQLLKTAERERRKELDTLPSALDVLALTDDRGQPLYDSYSYETSRGCPFTCAFCEWGTGAIGSRMYQFSLERIKRDWKLIFAAGIKDLWLADSNFGALKQDKAKAELICQFKTDLGLPVSFATSWSKKHSPQVQEIVLMLHRQNLLPHYQLALQTLTPLALELSNRKNMEANKYKPIAKQMSEQGVPIAAELIWGLPGDNLVEFETNLDSLLSQFPKVNIFGFTLLPGTEFYQKRDEYRIKTLPVAGYGKAKGEYVIGCHTYTENEGLEGYFLITAHALLNHGYVMPLTIRYLALCAAYPVSELLRDLLSQLLDHFYAQHHFENELAQLAITDRMALYENRAALYLQLLKYPQQVFNVLEKVLTTRLTEKDLPSQILRQIRSILLLDQSRCPRYGARATQEIHLDFDATRVIEKLEALELPDENDFSQRINAIPYSVENPGGLGDILKDPDGGSWMRGTIKATALAGST